MIPVSARRRKQRGNGMLESALCFLPMMAMFFGIIDVCYAVSIQSLLSQAVRAGTRFGITFTGTYNGTDCGANPGSGSQSVCIAQVVQDNAVGFLAGKKGNYVTVNYYAPNDLTKVITSCNAGNCTPAAFTPFTFVATTMNGTNQTIPVNYPNQPGNLVEVTIPNFPLLWMVPITGTSGYTYSAGSQVTDINGTKGLGLTLSATAADVLGGLTQGTTIPPNP
jgi:Flp pilus assembly protein TadG